MKTITRRDQLSNLNKLVTIYLEYSMPAQCQYNQISHSQTRNFSILSSNL